MMLVSSLIVAQTSTFKGKVVDELNEPLPGVSVLVKGTTSAITTDFNGGFEIELPQGNEQLVISYMGYITANFNPGNKKSGIISLKPDSQNLDEVVVTALGIKKEKKKLSYSVQEVQGRFNQRKRCQCDELSLRKSFRISCGGITRVF